MQKITLISGKAIPLARNDVDTDLIIPAQYLTSTSKEGYGEALFARLRQSDPSFVFNQEKFAEANILITQENFGCGSSREHAVWALQQGGIQAIIASSFADIFYGNSGKSGLILIKLPKETIEKMLQQAQSGKYELQIDLESQRIISNQNEVFDFELDSFRRHCFINGLDDLDYLLSHKAEIATYQQEHKNTQFLQ